MILKVVLGLIAYGAVIAVAGRFLSTKWHLDKGRGVGDDHQ